MKKTRFVAGSAVVLCVAGALTATTLTNVNHNKDNTSIIESAQGRDTICLAGLSAVMNGSELMDFEKVDSEINRLAGLSAAMSSYGAEWTQLSVEQREIDFVATAGVNATVLKVSNVSEEAASDDLVAENNDSVAGEESEKDSSVKDSETLSEISGNVQEESAGKEKLTKEQKEWKDYLMADVREFLNIRADASEDAEVVGKLRKGDRALIKKKGKVWTKIASGDAVGYVKNEYCVFGKDALAYAQEHCDRIAKVMRDGVRVRKSQSTESSILQRMSEGDTLIVNTRKKTKEGWIAVKVDSSTGYISSDYVTLSYKTTKAITIEEEKEAEREAASRAAENSDKSTDSKDSDKSESPKKEQGESLAATADEKTLLGALIYCEAGGESYDCQLAVGAVVINRIQSGSYPDNMYDVIYQRGQFGPAITGKLERVLASGFSSTSMRAAEEALSGVDNTDGCLSFNDSFCGHSGLHIDTMVFW